MVRSKEAVKKFEARVLEIEFKVVFYMLPKSSFFPKSVIESESLTFSYKICQRPVKT